VTDTGSRGTNTLTSLGLDTRLLCLTYLIAYMAWAQPKHPDLEPAELVELHSYPSPVHTHTSLSQSLSGQAAAVPCGILPRTSQLCSNNTTAPPPYSPQNTSTRPPHWLINYHSNTLSSLSLIKYRHLPAKLCHAAAAAAAAAAVLPQVSAGLPGFSAAEVDHVGQELSDVLLYLVRLADVCGVDLGAAVQQKMAHNAAK